jgi:hypothetical protein
MPSKSVQAKIAKLEPRIAELRRDLDKLINERICDVAEEISGVPYELLKRLLINRCHGFCRCDALRRIADGDDGI